MKKIKRQSILKKLRLAGIGHNNKNTTMPANGQAHGSLKRKGYYLVTTTTSTTTTTTTA